MEFQIQLHDSSKLSQNIWVFLEKNRNMSIEVFCFVSLALIWLLVLSGGLKRSCTWWNCFSTTCNTTSKKSENTGTNLHCESVLHHYYTEYWVSLYFFIFCLQEAGLVILFKVFPELLQSFWNSLVAFSLNPIFVPVQKQVKSLTTDI